MTAFFPQPTSVFSQLRLSDFMPCTLKVNTDWAKVETSHDNVYFMKAPCSGEAQTYSGGVQFTQKSIQVGIPDLKNYSTKKIPFVAFSSCYLRNMVYTRITDFSLPRMEAPSRSKLRTEPIPTTDKRAKATEMWKSDYHTYAVFYART